MSNSRSRARTRRRWIKRGLLLFVAGLFVAIVVYALIPAPVAVDTAVVQRKPIAVRLVENGQTRLRDRYVVRAPIAGNLERISLWPGDTLEPDKVVARLTAIAPPLLSAQDRRRAQARLTAARASLEAARAESTRATLAVDKLKDDVERIEELARRGAAPRTRLDEVRHAYRDAVEAAASSRFRISVALGERRAAEAVLGIGDGKDSAPGRIELEAPIAGTVLRVHRRDAGPVATGEPLLELGDLRTLEIVVDVLTADAVGIPPTARVELRGWGGDSRATARVSHVEPAGFTRISALGVEEQRVNVIARFDQPPPKSLGDAFGVVAEIVLEERAEATVIPSGALFRSGDNWAVFRVADGRAHLTVVEVGVRGDFETEIREGLEPGDTVVMHPGDQISSGTKVERR